jgi:hypothetical protein
MHLHVTQQAHLALGRRQQEHLLALSGHNKYVGFTYSVSAVTD